MNANEFIPLLGQTSEDAAVKKFLASSGISKRPKLKSGDVTAYLVNEKAGMDVTFRDERHLKVKSREYDEGSLVVSNISLYGEGDSSYKKFAGELPLGMTFDLGRKEVQAKLGKKPNWESKDPVSARWDFKGYCLFIDFEKNGKRMKNLAIQLPVG